MINRIEELVEVATHGNKSMFANIIGVNQQTFNNYIKGTRSLALETVSAILDSYPYLSAEWLLRGKGSMFITDNLPPFHGKESESEEELQARLIKLQVEYDNEVEEHHKLLAQLEYMEDYNRRMAVENHNLKKKLSQYEPQDKKAIV